MIFDLNNLQIDLFKKFDGDFEQHITCIYDI
jgi:hypothetical protein